MTALSGGVALRWRFDASEQEHSATLDGSTYIARRACDPRRTRPGRPVWSKTWRALVVDPIGRVRCVGVTHDPIRAAAILEAVAGRASCDCGGSGWVPSANDAGDVPCPRHANPNALALHRVAARLRRVGGVAS